LRKNVIPGELDVQMVQECDSMGVTGAGFHSNGNWALSFAKVMREQRVKRRDAPGNSTPPTDIEAAKRFFVILHIVAVVILGLMCGSELNVGAFAHPMLNAQTLDVHVPVRAALAKLFGRVMPFWMTGSTLLNLALLLPFEGLKGASWRYAAIAFAVQMSAVLFSIIFPVPINNRIIRWTPTTVPEDWRAQEHRWDAYHFFRTAGLIGAFALLTLSLAVR
jgi:uncharacterized membrane protein